MTATPSIEHLERLLGRLLVTGVVSSAACLAAGLILFMVDSGSIAADRLLRTGLIMLMATPVMRVVVSVVEYVRMRDWFFVGTTAVVLVELAWTVFYALR